MYKAADFVYKVADFVYKVADFVDEVADLCTNEPKCMQNNRYDYKASVFLKEAALITKMPTFFTAADFIQMQPICVQICQIVYKSAELWTYAQIYVYIKAVFF